MNDNVKGCCVKPLHQRATRLIMVRSARLELARVAPPPPQDGVSANSTTTALCVKMASQERFELPTDGLEGRCSIQLSYWDRCMEGVPGFEPGVRVLQTRALPLGYTPSNNGAIDGIRTHECRSHNPVR
jgi:hypothetical protein